jgi:hypothetical protein
VKRFLTALLGLSIIVLLVWGAYFILTKITATILNLNTDLAVAIIAGSVTVIVSIVSLIISKYYERRDKIQQEIRQKKIPVYEELIAFLTTTIFAEKMGETKPTEVEIVKFFANFTNKMIVWGSDEVLNAYQTMRSHTLNGKNSVELLFLYEKLLFEIRKDLGHKNKNLDRGSVLSLFVNDVYKHL